MRLKSFLYNILDIAHAKQEFLLPHSSVRSVTAKTCTLLAPYMTLHVLEKNHLSEIAVSI